jgi:hypothetical protein
MTYCPHDGDPATCPPCRRDLKPLLVAEREAPVSGAVIASYRGACATCPHPIEEGDVILHQGDGWVHEECWDPWG